jgi:hypothetical protein
LINPIHILIKPISIPDLHIFKGNPFESMIKYVVDTQKRIVALGGEMHADAEQVLILNGSNQSDIWGANIYPWIEPIELEYVSLINIRPTFGNKSMEIKDESLRNLIKTITHEWILIQ